MNEADKGDVILDGSITSNSGIDARLNGSNDLIDVSAWTGNWPFIKLRFTELNQLKAKLQSLHITKAFVAPIEAILEQDPMRANNELLAAVNDSFFSPVPVIDLSYANWQETLERAAADDRVRMIKLLPNYHMYELHEKQLAPLVLLTSRRNIVISIQMRVEDMRGQYHLMQVKDLDVVQVVKTMAYFPEQQFILSNPLLAELNEVLHSRDHIYVDIPSLESIDIVDELSARYSLDNILFASHSPFYVAEAAVYKLKLTEALPADIRRIACANAQRLFGL